jgi:hypothetical protein
LRHWFIVRWLAAQRYFGENVEVIGADFNEALITKHATSVCRKTQLHFVVANAFRLDHPPRSICQPEYFITSAAKARRSLSQHDRQETHAFVHFDFHSSPMSPFGSWLFHAVRMREPLAKHDGVLSAVRAHKSRYLLEAARSCRARFCVGRSTARDCGDCRYRECFIRSWDPSCLSRGVRAETWAAESHPWERSNDLFSCCGCSRQLIRPFIGYREARDAAR